MIQKHYNIYQICGKIIYVPKNSKNGYFNCKKFKVIPMEVLKKEYRKFLVSKEDPKRLEYLKNKLEYFNGGTI